MKAKKMMLAGSLICLMGLAVFCVGYLGAGRDLSVVNGRLGLMRVDLPGRDGTAGEEFSVNLYAFDPEGIREIVLRETNDALRVGRSPDGLIHLSGEESADFYFAFPDSGAGRLEIRRESRITINFGFFGQPDTETELLIPDRLDCHLTVEDTNGAIALSDLMLASLTASSSNGYVDASRLNAGNLTLSSSNGSVFAWECSSGAAVLQSKNGRVEAENVSCTSLRAETSNGSVRLSGVSADQEIRAVSDNGSISVSGLSAGQAIELRSELGSIEGTLTGRNTDYTIKSGSELGSNSLPADWGSGPVSLEVFTELGSIELGFEE